MNEFPWLALLGLVVAIVLLVLLVRAPSLLRGGVLPGRIGGYRVELQPALILEAAVTDQVWSIPIIFINTQRTPLPLPLMWHRRLKYS